MDSGIASFRPPAACRSGGDGDEGLRVAGMQHRQHVLYRLKPRQPGGGGFGKNDVGCGGCELFEGFDRRNVAVENGVFAERACHIKNIERQFRPAHIHQHGVVSGEVR
ncbi:hypothetical protein D3C78_1292790 [compost metagenome]